MDETRKGMAALVLACLIWGVMPLYYRQLDHVPALTVLAHRVFWSLVLFGLVLTVQRRWPDMRGLFATPRSRALILGSAAVIGFNWFLFIWAIVTGHALEASLGYYIFPLMAVLAGRLAFGERMDRASRIAVALAALAVVVLGFGLGAPPWISLMLAFSFAIYGVFKKLLAAGPVLTVTAEALLVTPFALAWLLGSVSWGWGGSSGFDEGWGTLVLLILSGPLTTVPLVLFSYAARRISFGTLGVIQYLNPSMQFLSALFVFGQPLSRWHMVALPMIWLALALYSAAALARDRAARNAAIVAGTSGRAVM